jgi:hypothetical protein
VVEGADLDAAANMERNADLKKEELATPGGL